MQPAGKTAYKLMHQGALALSQMEAVGLPIDSVALQEATQKIRDEVATMEAALREDPVYYEQRKAFGAKSNVNSRNQLAHVIYKVLKLAPERRSEKGSYVMDDAVINDLDHIPYLVQFRKTQQKQKLLSTYLLPFREHMQNGRVHPVFNLHLARTYRSSSDSPNLQNLPVRNPEIGKVLRSLVRSPYDDTVIVEIDYSTLEVVIGACIHKDPNMAEYLLTGFDFHRATAQELFFLGDVVPKPLRQIAKTSNFSIIYGDFYIAVATKAWKAIRDQMFNGEPVVEHLRRDGILRLGTEHDEGPGTFMYHVKGVCDRFWGERFPVFAAWRKRTWDDYLRHGFFYTPTGFRIHGIMTRNEVTNVATQGSAFHTLLQSVIHLTNSIRQYHMRSRLLLQIHDSILAEVPRNEVHDYVSLATEIMTQLVPKEWDWITLPLGVEAEVGETWADKKAYKHE